MTFFLFGLLSGPGLYALCTSLIYSCNSPVSEVVNINNTFKLFKRGTGSTSHICQCSSNVLKEQKGPLTLSEHPPTRPPALCSLLAILQHRWSWGPPVAHPPVRGRGPAFSWGLGTELSDVPSPATLLESSLPTQLRALLKAKSRYCGLPAYSDSARESKGTQVKC